jgi:ParB/RepB/Spo0J family partition protein
MKVIDVPINHIHISDRHRRDLGDMEGLTANIREMGLLQPIGIDEYFNLIYGARRAEACENLGWKKIPCVVLKLKSVLAGEYAENEFRKQFTPSERAAIGRAIEAELGNRKGANLPNSPKHSVSAIAVTGNTVDLAAKRAGFKSTETYERAKTVVDRGAPELLAAMDKGDISIDAAAKIATQPKADQARIVAMPKDEQREVVNRIRKTKAEQAANEARARDIYLFRGLHDAVKFIAEFTATPEETWPGISRVSAWAFPENLDRALDFLTHLRKAHPNALRKPEAVAKGS